MHTRQEILTEHRCKAEGESCVGSSEGLSATGSVPQNVKKAVLGFLETQGCECVRGVVLNGCRCIC